MYGLQDMDPATVFPVRRGLLALADLKFQASNFGFRLCSVFRGSGGAKEVLTTHIDDVLGCGDPGIL